MSTVAILKEHVTALDEEIGRKFPQVEKVEPLVLKALAFLDSGKTSANMLESTGMLEQLVHAAHICQNHRQVEHDTWDDLSARLEYFLDSVQETFEIFHPNWEVGEVYIDWTALNDPCYGSDEDGESDFGDSIQDVHHEVAFAYDQNKKHEYRRQAVDEYDFFVSWLNETNHCKIYHKCHEHLLCLREDDKYAHVPIHFPGALDTDRS